MKNNIHPKYDEKASTTCSCGAVFLTGGTKGDMQVEICSQCHPFYTGKKKMIDSTGRVDRFKKMTEKATVKKASTGKKKIRVKKTKEMAPPKANK